MNAEPMTDARLAQLRTINAALEKCGRKMWGPGLSPFGDPTDVAADAIDDLLNEVDRLRAELKATQDEIDAADNRAYERSERES